eukprot:scaffold50_cov420-Prasinococcus_capsulatus_cf.AAC.25
MLLEKDPGTSKQDFTGVLARHGALSSREGKVLPEWAATSVRVTACLTGQHARDRVAKYGAKECCGAKCKGKAQRRAPRIPDRASPRARMSSRRLLVTEFAGAGLNIPECRGSGFDARACCQKGAEGRQDLE